MKDELVIGVLGGMGTYATIHLFEQYAELFKAKKEWDRPRIVIDNRCTMPSRVRAFLFNENVDLLVEQMSESMNGLLSMGCNRIILACNTSHLFLPEIYKRYPNLKNSVVDIIEKCVGYVASRGISSVYLLGSEGTIESKVYERAFEEEGIKCDVPSKEDYCILRDCIEAVKTNEYNNGIKNKFLKLVNSRGCCVLGCTELPILYEKYKDDVLGVEVFDPLLIGLESIRQEFD